LLQEEEEEEEEEVAMAAGICSWSYQKCWTENTCMIFTEWHYSWNSDDFKMSGIFRSCQGSRSFYYCKKKFTNFSYPKMSRKPESFNSNPTQGSQCILFGQVPKDGELIPDDVEGSQRAGGQTAIVRKKGFAERQDLTHR
jgi:hypothetical protein